MLNKLNYDFWKLIENFEFFFKITSKAQVQQKQVNKNSANQHNLNAAQACGFDASLLGRTNFNNFNSMFNGSGGGGGPMNQTTSSKLE